MAEFNALMRDARIVPPVEPNALLQTPTQADAWTQNAQAVRSLLNVTPEQVQDLIAPAPNTTYGSVLPFAQDNTTGDVRWWPPVLPQSGRDLLQLGYDLSQGPRTGTVSPETSLGLLETVVPGAMVTRPGVNALLRSGPGFKTYHGSPHSFDRFDSSKIGTGEGTTAPKGLDPRLFVPAMRMTMDGRKTVFSGKPGELHEQVVNRVADANEDAYFAAKDHDLGFVNSATGRYYTRDQAAEAIGVWEASGLPTFKP